MEKVDLSDLKTTFEGIVTLPGDPGYEQASTTFAAKGAPAIIFQPQRARGVATAIRYAREYSLAISIRSGGHSGAGLSTNTGGVVIDMAQFNSVELLDKGAGLVRIGSGAAWGDVAAALAPHGLVLSSGDTKSVGVGGLTLGGGIGIMVRKYGLAIDSLIAAEVVTANGNTLRVSEQENADLFWAIRGGGGNFGVVTYFEFKAHPLTSVIAGTVQYAIDDLKTLLTNWRNAMRAAASDVTTTLVIMPAFGDNPSSAQLHYCYAGDDNAASDIELSKILAIAPVLKNTISPKPYQDALEEAHPPGGVKAVVKDAMIEVITDELVETLTDLYTNAQGRMMFLRSLGGAMRDTPADQTAFAYRNSEALLVGAAFVPMDATETQMDEAADFWKPIALTNKGAYVNFLSAYKDSDVIAVYPPETLERLRSIKARYDPENIFNQNCNITPKS